jgi:hypothetical protein
LKVRPGNLKKPSFLWHFIDLEGELFVELQEIESWFLQLDK